MKTLLLLVCAMPAFVTSAHAALIFDNADTPQFTTQRNGTGVAAYLAVGSSNVIINQIAIHAGLAASGQLEFLIFNDVAYPGNDAGSVLFSDTVNVSPSNSLAYLLSDPIAFTLQAGQYYDIGAIFNGGNITYAYDLVSDTMGGITSIARNENIGQFSNPVLLGHALGDAQIQLYSNATVAPEPSPSTTVGLGLAALAIYWLAGGTTPFMRRYSTN